MAIRFKSGVSLEKLTPQLTLALVMTQEVLDWYRSDLTVTSLDDGKHSTVTLHGKGRAFDFRIWDVHEAVREDMVVALRERLGREFDVVLEPDHCHVEWDPDYLKTPPKKS